MVPSSRPTAANTTRPSDALSLTLPEYRRYGRQMILEGFGLPGQLKLKAAKVAVIGAGGLGCPCLQYLVGAGVGEIGIFDFDHVEESNLHRQILHTTDRVGWNKSESAKIALEAPHSLNPLVNIQAIESAILPSTALDLLRPYSLLVDCTDRPQTRYLISDAAVRLDLPLVSGAAIANGGQWCTYGGVPQAGIQRSEGRELARKKRGCYRCIWPKPLMPTGSQGAGTCEEEGVWGPVTGLVGTAMAAEAIKVIVGVDDAEPRLSLMSLAPLSTPFRSIKIRGASPKCIACGPNATITDDLDAVGYEAFCGVADSDDVGEDPFCERISVQELEMLLKDSTASENRPILIDVRPEVEFGICSLPGSINVPYLSLLQDPLAVLEPQLLCSSASQHEILFICRRGNDSLLATQVLKKAFVGKQQIVVKDVRGGVRAWSKEVDRTFPLY